MCLSIRNSMIVNIRLVWRISSFEGAIPHLEQVAFVLAAMIPGGPGRPGAVRSRCVAHGVQLGGEGGQTWLILQIAIAGQNIIYENPSRARCPLQTFFPARTSLVPVYAASQAIPLAFLPVAGGTGGTGTQRASGSHLC